MDFPKLMCLRCCVSFLVSKMNKAQNIDDHKHNQNFIINFIYLSIKSGDELNSLASGEIGFILFTSTTLLFEFEFSK